MNIFERLTDHLQQVKTDSGSIKTQVFLDICSEVIPVITNLGTGFGIVRSDVGGNIDRLQKRLNLNPVKYSNDLFQIVLDEVEEGTAADSTSCTKGLLWLKRAMEFIIDLLKTLETDKDSSLSEIATKTYYETLQKYHGWLVTGTFTVVLKLVPSRESFWKTLMDNEQSKNQKELEYSMQQFCPRFEEVLATIHSFLHAYDLDDPTKV